MMIFEGVVELAGGASVAPRIADLQTGRPYVDTQDLNRFAVFQCVLVITGVFVKVFPLKRVGWRPRMPKFQK
jgi:hypothetical protein